MLSVKKIIGDIMENQNERILAYKAAHEIDNDDMEKVSGGIENFSFTTRETASRYGYSGDFGVDGRW